jgi:hypothetical protein
MAYKNKYDSSGQAFDAGDKAESLFEQALEKAGKEFRRASFKEEISHIDFVLFKTDTSPAVAIDVKARKKIKRSDDAVNDDLIWVEFKNVAGRRGWLYGKADIIAFEREENFILVNRKLFARLCEKLCDLTKINEDVRTPLYTGYQRRNRQDILSLIKITDITDNIKYSTLPK